MGGWKCDCDEHRHISDGDYENDQIKDAEYSHEYYALKKQMCSL